MTKPGKSSRQGLLLLVLSSVLLVSGCGGDGNDSDAPALTKGAFIAKANAICDKADKRQAAGYKAYLKENGADKSKAGEETLIVAVGLPPIRKEIEELRELGMPTEDEEEISEMLDEVETAVKENEEKPLSVYTAQNPFKAVEEQAKKYGLAKCGFT